MYSRRDAILRGLSFTLGGTLLSGCGGGGSDTAAVAPVQPSPPPLSPPSPPPPPTPEPPVFQISSISYASSIDPILFPKVRMTVAFDRRRLEEKSQLPLLMLGHGSNQRDTDFAVDTVRRFAERGFFVAVPDMRTKADWLPATGYENSGRDSQGRMTIDVVDAMKALQTDYGSYIDFGRRAYSGYSGSEALALAMKAPWAFDQIISYFGIAEYSQHLAAGGDVQLAARTAGGYAARNAIVGVPMNRRSGFLTVAWDIGDRFINVTSQQLIVDALLTSGKTPFEFYRSGPSDINRFTHGLPNFPNADPGAIEDRWISAAIMGEQRRGNAPSSGVGYYIPGFIWLGDPLNKDTPFILLGDGETAGQQHAALLSYELTSRLFTVTPLNGPNTITIRWGAETVQQTINSTTTIRFG